MKEEHTHKKWKYSAAEYTDVFYIQRVCMIEGCDEAYEAKMPRPEWFKRGKVELRNLHPY